MTWEKYQLKKGVPDSEYEGHRTFPYRKDGLNSYASREDSSKELIRLANHAAIFRNVNDPTDP